MSDEILGIWMRLLGLGFLVVAAVTLRTNVRNARSMREAAVELEGSRQDLELVAPWAGGEDGEVTELLGDLAVQARSCRRISWLCWATIVIGTPMLVFSGTLIILRAP